MTIQSKVIIKLKKVAEYNNAKEIAKSLLDIEAVTLSPNHSYTRSSGIKSPIYCDNRVTLGYPSVRGAIRDGLINLIKDTFRKQ